MAWTGVLLVFGLLLTTNGQSDDWRNKPDDLTGPAGAKSSPNRIVPISNPLNDDRDTVGQPGLLIKSSPGITDEVTRILLRGDDNNDEGRNLGVSIDGRVVTSEIIGSEPTLDRKAKSLLGGSGDTGGVPVFDPTLYEKRDALRDVLDTVNDVVSAKRGNIISVIDSGQQPMDSVIADELDIRAEVTDRRRDAIDNILSERMDKRMDLVDGVEDKLGEATDNLQDDISVVGPIASDGLDLLDSRQDAISDITDNVHDALSDISDRRFKKLDNKLDSIDNRHRTVGDIIDNFDDNLENVVDRVADRTDSKRDIIENIVEIKKDYVDDLMERVEDKLDGVDESRDERRNNMMDGIGEIIDRRQDIIEDRADAIYERFNNYGDVNDGASDWLKEAVEREMDRHGNVKIDEIDIKDPLDFWDHHLHSNDERRLNSKSILNLAYRLGEKANRRTKARINMRIPKIGLSSTSKRISKTVASSVRLNKYNWYPNRYALDSKSDKNSSPVGKSRVMNKGLRISIKSKDDDDDDKSMKIEIKTDVNRKREDHRDDTSSINRRNSFRRRTRPLLQPNRRGVLSRRRSLYTNPRPSFRPPFTRRTGIRRPPYGMRPGPDFRPGPRGFPYPGPSTYFRPHPFGGPFQPVPRAMPFGPPMMPF